MDTDDVAKAVRLYSDLENGEFSKILPNEAFGYRTITVERPLRLNFQVSPERLSRLYLDKSLAKNGINLKDLETALISMGSSQLFKSRSAFLKALDAVLKTSNINVSAPQYKAIWHALSERDETADVCVGAKGGLEPDSDLRDTENVPLDEPVQTYFDREVRPYISDAWIDQDKTRIGYEIPFNRYFYKYAPPRPLEAIDANLAEVTKDIVVMLDGMRA
jgi:type I restriction enzyme M protein